MPSRVPRVVREDGATVRGMFVMLVPAIFNQTSRETALPVSITCTFRVFVITPIGLPTVRPTAKSPARVGTPLITPVPASKPNPGGRLVASKLLGEFAAVIV